MSLREIENNRKEKFQLLHILITGSSQGIGLAAAKRLVKDGHMVYHACRTPQRSQQAVIAAGGGIALEVGCDLSDMDSIQQFAKEANKVVPKLDVICLNAGISPSTSPGTKPLLTKQGLEGCIGVNHLGHFLLAQLLVPKLAKDGGGRLVITASSDATADYGASFHHGKRIRVDTLAQRLCGCQTSDSSSNDEDVNTRGRTRSEHSFCCSCCTIDGFLLFIVLAVIAIGDATIGSAD